MARAMISALFLVLFTGIASAQPQIQELLPNDDSVPSYQSAPLGMGAAQATTTSVAVANPAAVVTPASDASALAPSAGNVLGGNSAQAMNAENPMASLLSSLTATAHAGSATAGVHSSANMTHSGSGQYGPVLSQDSMAVVSGLIEQFMHKMALLPGERACLERNMATLSADVMGTVGDVATAIKALVEGRGKVDKEATGGVMSAGIDAAMKITSLVGSTTQLVKSCVHGDALVMLKQAAENLVNGSYLEHRIIVNGVDIARALADSVTAFEEKDFHRFGADIGLTLRKVALSNATNATRLPEGVPDKVVIQKATDGLMRGFFVPNSSMEVTDTAQADIDIKVDLHQCLSANSEFFKEVWMATWDLIAQLSVNAQEHGLSGITDMFQQQEGQEQPKWSGELMIAMMQFPMALSNCGVSPDMQNMFVEALKTLPQIKVHFSFPSDPIQPTQVSSAMAQAVVAWSNWDFEKFGYRLGVLFRQLIMLAFPQKYAIDASGRLRLNADIQALTVNQKSGLISASMIIGGAAVCLLVILAVLRTRKSKPHLLLDHREAVMDLEDGDELVE
jgi:hypothetical protein